jgi:hypothetical protein
MEDLRDGIMRAKTALQGGLRRPVASPGPWEEIVGNLDAALEAEKAGDKQAALQHVDIATGHLKNLAVMKRGTFELMDMEDSRREALRILDNLARAI